MGMDAHLIELSPADCRASWGLQISEKCWPRWEKSLFQFFNTPGVLTQELKGDISNFSCSSSLKTYGGSKAWDWKLTVSALMRS